MTIYEGISFGVEWQGREVAVFVTYEAIQDMGRFIGRESDAAYQRLLKDHRGKILDTTAKTLRAGRLDRHDRVSLTGEDFPGLQIAHESGASRG